jgi:hypothetical protein
MTGLLSLRGIIPETSGVHQTGASPPEHPFLTEHRSWVAASELRVGDEIRSARQQPRLVESIAFESTPSLMYNLTVEDAHTYFVGDGAWLVHNTCFDYRKTFFDKYPHLEGKVWVHHAVPQRILTRYPGRFTEAEIHALDNLRGIPVESNNTLHLSAIAKEWNNFYKNVPNASRQDIVNYAAYVDRKYGDQFLPAK